MTGEGEVVHLAADRLPSAFAPAIYTLGRRAVLPTTVQQMLVCLLAGMISEVDPELCQQRWGWAPA